MRILISAKVPSWTAVDHNSCLAITPHWIKILKASNSQLAVALWFSPRQCDPDARWSKRTIAISMFARVRNWKPVTFTVHGLQLLCSTCSGTPFLPFLFLSSHRLSPTPTHITPMPTPAWETQKKAALSRPCPYFFSSNLDTKDRSGNPCFRFEMI